MDDDMWLDEDDDEDESHTGRSVPPGLTSRRPLPGRPVRKKTSPALIASIIIGSIFSLSAIGLLAYVATNRLTNVTVTVTAVRSRPELNSESLRVFTEFDSLADTTDLSSDELSDRKEIDALLRRIEVFGNSGDPSQVSDIVDFKRLAKRIELTGALADWNALDKASLRPELAGLVSGELELGTLTLAGVVKVPDDPPTRIAYVIAAEEASKESGEFRLWIAPTDKGEWKVYDWERLDLGLSQSEELGVYCRYAEDARLDGYYDWSNHIERANELMLEQDRESAAEQIRLAESCNVVPELADFCHLLSGYTWQQIGDFPQARVSFENIQNPEQTPGAFYGLLNCSEFDDEEFALRNANQYEQCVGPSADVCSRKARLLDRLERTDEAVFEWKKVIRFQPNHPEALSAILKEFADERKSLLKPYLERLEDPVQIAIAVADYLEWDDRTSRGFLISFVKSREPDSARTEAMFAGSLRMEGKLAQAAERYEAVLKKEQDDTDRSGYVSDYLYVMTELGRILDAIERVPNKSEAFQELLGMHEEGDIEFSDDEYQEIARRYYEQYPDDEWAVYYRAFALNEVKDATSAIGLLKSFLDSTASKSTGINEYADSSLRSLLASAQVATGQRVETLLEADHSNLSTLASAALRDERWSVVQELIAACRATSHDGLEFLRLRSRLAEHEQRWADALEDCTRAQGIIKTSSDQSELSWEFDRIQRTAHLNSGRLMEYYDRQEDKQNAFRTLATTLISRRDWSEFRKLAERHRSNAPGDPVIPQLSSESEWFQEDYAACARSCKEAVKKVATDFEGSLSQWQISRLQARQLECLLRLRRLREAKTLAEQALKDEQDLIPLAIVAAAAGNEEEARRIANEAFEKTESIQQLYTHQEAGPFFLQESFAELHERCPVELPHGWSRDKAVFLFDTPPSLDSKTITQLMKKLAPNEQSVVEEYESVHPKATAAFTVKLSNSTIQIVSGAGPFGDWQLTRPDSQYSSILENSAAWLAITGGSWSDHGKQDFRISRQLARQLSHKATGVCIFSNWRWRLIQPVGPEMQRWETTGTLPAYPEFGVGVEMKVSDIVVPTREFARALNQVAVSWNADESGDFEVQCQIGDQELGEPVWVKVHDARHISYGSYEFDGILKLSSKLVSTMRAGLEVTVSQWRVRAWRRSDEPMHVHPANLQ